MGEKLRPKYIVFRILSDGSGNKPEMLATNPENIDSPFVLMPRKDPAAFYALANYAQACEPSLSREIRVFLQKVIEAPPLFGTQGARNRVVMMMKQMDLIE